MTGVSMALAGCVSGAAQATQNGRAGMRCPATPMVDTGVQMIDTRQNAAVIE
jgi:hypothetical protein